MGVAGLLLATGHPLETPPVTSGPNNPQPSPVTFTETGLGAGVTWTIQLNEEYLVGSTSSLSFSSVWPGTYGWFANASGYAPLHGTLTTDGTPVSITVGFVAAATFPTFFNETGIPYGAGWTVEVSGFNVYGTSHSLVVAEPNGTYSYYVYAADPTFACLPSTGTLHVNGAAQAISITCKNNGI